jgi:signal peptidase I
MNPSEGAVQDVLANLSIGTIVVAALVLTVVRLALVPIRSALARSVAELVESLLVAGVLVFLIIRPFLLQAFFIPSESMEPTLMGHKKGYNESTNQNYKEAINDHIFVNKLVYRYAEPKSGDIIVFRAPAVADMSAKATGRNPVENVLIKRLIGTPGDTLQIKPDENGVVRVFRNGTPMNERYINEAMKDLGESGAPFATTEPLKLGSDELFVMGDNRNFSNDSRFWGVLKRNRVIGKAMFIFWPPKRVGIVR